MAFLRHCLHELRAMRRDWAPEDMDWFRQTVALGNLSHAGSPVPAFRAAREGSAHRNGRSIAVPRISHGGLIRGHA
ncbi:hypothetical protein WKW80_36790 [Variovorax humicola]|uniref:Uncharacterized protein n=1 Tax=Variovorax humicola TaxID=1769758 RepID=A0ABU8WC15_9BURK